jgi:hypothetical protein
MATIYTITMTTSYFDNQFNSKGKHTSVVGAYNNEMDAKDYLHSRIDAYDFRLADNILNRIELTSKSIKVVLHDKDESCCEYSWRVTSVELQ